jgi:hypothetical protein
MGFVVHKAALGQVFSKYFSFPASYSTNCSTLIIVWGWYDRSTYQVDSVLPHPMKNTTTIYRPLTDKSESGINANLPAH